VHEAAGLVFAYLGEAEGGDAGAVPPPPYFPEFEQGYAAQAYGGIWPCNYFTQLDNAVDTLHTTFVHWQFGRGVQTLQVEPLESGLVVHPHGPGAGYPNFFHMPNSHEWATPPPRGQTVWDFTKGWRVPVDDHHHARFDVSVMPLRGAEGEAYLATWGHKGTEATTMDVVRAILAGESSVRAAEAAPI